MALYFVSPILPKSIQSFILPLFGIIAALILLLFDKTANNVKNFRVFKIIFSILFLVISVYAFDNAKWSRGNLFKGNLSVLGMVPTSEVPSEIWGYVMRELLI